jgi:hypothetical protein
MRGDRRELDPIARIDRAARRHRLVTWIFAADAIAGIDGGFANVDR